MFQKIWGDAYMKLQREIFRETEGDSWNKRNLAKPDYTDILSSLDKLRIVPRNVLEIGCGRGYCLAEIQNVYGASISGIDPSSTAISQARALDGEFRIGTAEKIDFKDNALT
jgi:SAM-dependent methyltransferase